MSKVLHLRKNKWSLAVGLSIFIFVLLGLNSLFYNSPNPNKGNELNTSITADVDFKEDYVNFKSDESPPQSHNSPNTGKEFEDQKAKIQADLKEYHDSTPPAEKKEKPLSDETKFGSDKKFNEKPEDNGNDFSSNKDIDNEEKEEEEEENDQTILDDPETKKEFQSPNQINAAKKKLKKEKGKSGIKLAAGKDTSNKKVDDEIPKVKEVPKQAQEESDTKNPNQKAPLDEKTAKELIQNVKEELLNAGSENSNLDESSLQQMIDKILEDKLQTGQDSLLDSSYVKNVITKEDEDEKDNKIIQNEIKEMKENANVDTNPAKVSKDWTIKVNPEVESVTPEKFRNGDPLTKSLFKNIVELMYGNRLSFPLQQRMNMKNGKTVIEPVVLVSEITDDMSEAVLTDLFKFPTNFLEDAKVKHKIVTDNLPNIEPNFYGGNGYVTVGGGKYSWFALLVIEVLRKLGSIYPVEVFIPSDDEYEPVFCEEILPKYNARCVLISNVFDSALIKKIKVTGYQYKSLALLASSFENTFLLDSDNYPVINPDHLFESELYKKYNMITWPDYWRRTTSPYYYQIVGKTVGKQVRYLDDEDTDPNLYKLKVETKNKLRKVVQFHDREGTLKEWTTESGEMVINKKIHFKSLLLALYYNLEGQFGYYPLLSQGGAGEGDKETFVAAAHFYNLDYYQVHKKPDRAYGFHKWRKNLVDTSIVQYDPVRDYEVLQYVNQGIKADIKLMGEHYEYNYFQAHQNKFSIEVSRPIFYHVHETKMDPFELFKQQATFDLKGRKLRNLGGDFPRFDFDLELFLWQKVNRHICIENTDVNFISDPKRDEERLTLCSYFMPAQLDFLEKTHNLMVDKYEFRRPYDNLWRSDRLYLTIEEREKEDELQRLREDKQRQLEEELDGTKNREVAPDLVRDFKDKPEEKIVEVNENNNDLDNEEDI